MTDRTDGTQALIEALPYIQKYSGKIIVVKYGGGAMLNEDLKKAVMRDIVRLSAAGIKAVLVHGGGPEINAVMEKFGKKPSFVDGLRYTDSETAEIAVMALAGKVNKGLVSLIHSNKGNALGLCGIDGAMLKTEKIRGAADLGFVGDIKSVDPTPILIAMEHGFIPVIASVGADEAGQAYNINADTAAAAIAAAVNAEKLILMTDVRGVLADRDDEDTLIGRICIQEIPELTEKGIVSGGMIPKIDSCVRAIRGGVKDAAIIDGRIEHSILLELFSESGVGTLLYA
ncbi:MAG: acetylglutamate kinase [Clostridiales Family XIII bacterium]|jgi:acetylglutamate kinase|nr:acetylglutamate kinase [Clostridiales Family XIII bacterium]